jgi:putative addiction module killer protein
MFSIKPLPEFTRWMDALPDAKVRAVLVARIRRLSLGLMGDVAPVGDGISELRIHLGAGWRLYFVQRGKKVICVAGWWFQAQPSLRHQARQSFGAIVGLTKDRP